MIMMCLSSIEGANTLFNILKLLFLGIISEITQLSSQTQIWISVNPHILWNLYNSFICLLSISSPCPLICQHDVDNVTVLAVDSRVQDLGYPPEGHNWCSIVLSLLAIGCVIAGIATAIYILGWVEDDDYILLQVLHCNRTCHWHCISFSLPLPVT